MIALGGPKLKLRIRGVPLGTDSVSMIALGGPKLKLVLILEEAALNAFQ